MANPPFNVDDVSLPTVEKDKRFNTYGVPRNKGKTKKGDENAETVPNGNYLWINLFATSLKPGGRAALVMANSASDARHSEADIRRTLIEKNLIYGMLTLPSNLFYTVTLPATLWFFDKGKADDKILFIDARNIFTQVDRSHRELSDEQLQNIALIPRLHKGRRTKFVRLVARYFAQGIARLTENQAHIPALAAQLLAVLGEEDDAVAAGLGRDAVAHLQAQWADLTPLNEAHAGYQREHGADADVDAHNLAQRALQKRFTPFFTALHASLKQLDKAIRELEKRAAVVAKAAGKRGSTDRRTRVLKDAVQALHDEVKSAESWFQHIQWLQDRFPQAKYEDVTGLCKLASSEEVKEQDYSLNPGRYVGVVMEEDGKTEEEFLADLTRDHDLLRELSLNAQALEAAIEQNIRQMVDSV